ncbi:MAG: tetratricopeptide repeat protein [Bacteroidetes bacterium]|nr:tetratricopeptide repeat protein [Bacteroidota bacterium]
MNSILITFISGLYFSSLLKKFKTNIIDRNKFKNIGITAIVSFLLIPLLISLTHSLLTMSCSIIDGLLFYLVITFPSVLIGYALASLSIIAINRFNKIFFIILFLLILCIPLLEFYFYPQIYFFNPIFGYYPGTIYDEAMSVTLKLVEYRVLNIIYFGLIAFSITKILSTIKKNQRTIILSLSLIISVLFFFASPYFGFSTTFNKLNSELKGTAISKHFIIHYPVELDKNLVKALVIYHEYYYSELKNFFKYDYPRKIDSYLFESNGQKKKLFGTANADVAKPWLNCAFITYSDFNTTLKHELAHCYSSVFGSGIFKVAAGLNPYLIEGIAVAADPVYDNNDINYIASIAYNNGFKPELNNLFNYFSFFSQSSSISYVYAGSLTKYLINKFGIDKFKLLYQVGDFQKVYNESLNKILHNYYPTLIDSSLTSKKDEANFYFGRKSIFYKVCPRYVADRIQKAKEYLIGNNYYDAIKIFKDVLKITNDYSAIIGYADCLIKSNQIDEAKKIIIKYFGQFKNSAYQYSLELKLGDLYTLENNFTKADSLYKLLSLQNPNQTYYYLSNLRHELVLSGSLLLPYLKGNDFDKYNILVELNSKKYNYYSIPVLITLADSFNEDYNLFMKNFQFKIEVNDFASAFAMYKLSEYMILHLDFQRARKMAALATRFDDDKNFSIIANENYDKANWMYKNSARILSNLKIF